MWGGEGRRRRGEGGEWVGGGPGVATLLNLQRYIFETHQVSTEGVNISRFRINFWS